MPLLSADEAASAIDEIVSDALAHFDADRFWSAHPLDDGVSDGNTSFYFGAVGVIWALEYLRRVGATRADFDFRPSLPRLIEANRAEFAKGPHPAQGSFLFGDLTGASLLPEGQPVSIEFEDRSGESGALEIRRAGKQEPGLDWLYSKKLFTTFTIQESLDPLIKEAQRRCFA